MVQCFLGFNWCEVAPEPMDGSCGVGMYNWTYERVHLAHVTAQPEQPTASSSQDQAYLHGSILSSIYTQPEERANLYQLFVGSLRNPVATGRNSAPDQSEKDDGQSRGRHCIL